MTTPWMARQGDVLIIACDTPLPENAVPVERDRGRVILAYGEVTGHAHAVLDRDVTMFTVPGDNDLHMIAPSPSASVTHDEHAAIPLTAPGEYGHYIIRRQREYTPEAIRNVAD